MPTKVPMKAKDPSKSFTSSTLTKIAIVIRLVLVFCLLPPDLSTWIQSPALQSVLVDSLYTLQHVREAAAIRTLFAPHRFVDAYQEGSRIRLPPLLLATMESFIKIPFSSYWQHVFLKLILLLVDFWIAQTLERIGLTLIEKDRKDPWEEELQARIPEKIQAKLSHIFETTTSSDAKATTNDKSDKEAPLFRTKDLPFLLAQLYFCSPITMLASSMYGCFQNVRVALILSAVYHSCDGSMLWVAIALALATYGDVQSVVFLVPAALFVRQQSKSITPMLVAFLVSNVCLQGLSYLLTGSRYLAIVQSTHGHVFNLAGLAPSMSVLWYFQMELFQRFGTFYSVLLGGLPYLLVAPTLIRLYRYPIVLTAIYWLLWALFRPTATLFDFNVGLCLMLLSPRSLARMNAVSSLVSFCGILVPVGLYVIDYWLWLETGSGEANYLFFQCLAYNVFVTIFFLEFCGASMRRDKVLRITEKLEKEPKMEGWSN